MARRHRLIRTSPSNVWAVLADGTRYAEWVVGTAESHPVHGDWPRLGSAIRYEIRCGPFALHNQTVVRFCDEGREIGLEAQAGPLGSARIAIEIHPWGEDSLVFIDEHPLGGIGGKLHNMALEAALQIRHRAMLKHLADICECMPRTGSAAAVPQPAP